MWHLMKHLKAKALVVDKNSNAKTGALNQTDHPVPAGWPVLWWTARRCVYQQAVGSRPGRQAELNVAVTVLSGLSSWYFTFLMMRYERQNELDQLENQMSDKKFQ